MATIELPPASQKRLIELARATLEDFVSDIEPAPAQIDDPYLLTKDYGAFVSLHRGR